MEETERADSVAGRMVVLAEVFRHAQTRIAVLLQEFHEVCGTDMVDL
jgi:hypothetical protein